MSTTTFACLTRAKESVRCARCGGSGHTAPHCPWPDEAVVNEGRDCAASLVATRAVWWQVGVSFLALLACILIAVLREGVR